MERKLEKCNKRAKLVRKLRTDRAWPQSQLAAVADVSLRTIQRVERDGTAAFETLMSIASALDIDVKDLTHVTLSNSKLNKSLYLLPRISTGNQLSKIIAGADNFQVEHDESDDPRAIGAMKDIIKLLKQDIVRLYDSNLEKKFEVETELTQELNGLEKYGFYIFGIQRRIPNLEDKEISLCTLYMSHSNSPKIVKNKDSRMMVPAVLTEVLR